MNDSLPNAPSAPVPGLTWVFSLRGELGPPVEQGQIDGGLRRFIPVIGGKVYGPHLGGKLLAGGGDWQTVQPGGRTEVLARYFIEADDGTVIGVTNAGVRTATPEVIDRLTRGIEVPPDQYYFRTSPQFDVRDGPHGWLRRFLFVARAIRKPDHVVVDFYRVD